ncbi:hypothetical protein GOODEAATRI_016017 [Goodea atripinnis]|uniref:Uncharacterized protein n=1 Tax=Goodea atripinnis TaxID=208336 RepID=A0ABV0MI75_9TELE
MTLCYLLSLILTPQRSIQVGCSSYEQVHVKLMFCNCAKLHNSGRLKARIQSSVLPLFFAVIQELVWIRFSCFGPDHFPSQASESGQMLEKSRLFVETVN